MINPNLVKRVLVEVISKDKAIYKGVELDINYRMGTPKDTGRRYLYLKYSIAFDEYYLSDRSY